MRQMALSAIAVCVGFAVTVPAAGGQTIIISDSDPTVDVRIDNTIYGHMKRGLVQAGYDVHWLPELVPEEEEGRELIFQVVDTDQGYDATFILSDLYHDPELGIVRGRPMILYQFHGYADYRDIAEDALTDFLERLEEEKALAEEEPGAER